MDIEEAELTTALRSRIPMPPMTVTYESIERSFFRRRRVRRLAVGAAIAGFAVVGVITVAARTRHVAGPDTAVAVASPQASVAPAPRVCQVSNLKLTLAFAMVGPDVVGTLQAENARGAACVGLLRPQVMPLNAKGASLRVPQLTFANRAFGPGTLAPGASTTSTINWDNWCGGAPAYGVEVGWRGGGTTVIQLAHPVQPNCQDRNGAGNITSSTFSPLTGEVVSEQLTLSP